mgnify:CR=1 FL=1
MRILKIYFLLGLLTISFLLGFYSYHQKNFIYDSIYNMYSQNNEPEIEIAGNNITYDIIYILSLLLGSYFINVNISKTLCNTENIQWFTITIYTIMPWLFIFFAIYIILQIFPGWCRPFSNTIGYLFVNTLGATDDFKKLLKSSEEIKNGQNGENSENSKLVNAIVNINKDYSRFINEISNEKREFYNFMNELKTAGIINYQDSDRSNFYKHIVIKHFIGKIVWYILSGILITSITYNYIINITCERTLDETQKMYNKLYSNTVIEIKGTKWQKKTDVKDRVNANIDFNILIENWRDDPNKFKSNKNIISFTHHELQLSSILTPIHNANSIYISVNGKNYIPIQ